MPRPSRNDIRDHAQAFAHEWKDETYERGEAQTFWTEFLREDAWRTRTADVNRTRQDVARRLEELEARRDRLEDAFIQRSAINQTSYDRQTQRLDQEERELSAALDCSTVPGVDLQAALSFARSLLTDLGGCWNRLEWQQKPPFLAALYPDGLTYGNGSLGTTRTPWLMAVSEAPDQGQPHWAPPTGFEPVLPP